MFKDNLYTSDDVDYSAFDLFFFLFVYVCAHVCVRKSFNANGFNVFLRWQYYMTEFHSVCLHVLTAAG